MHDLLLLVFLDSSSKYELEVCNGYHDVSIMAFELENITILHRKGVDHRCVKKLV